jgi:hypothetical protein
MFGIRYLWRRKKTMKYQIKMETYWWQLSKNPLRTILGATWSLHNRWITLLTIWLILGPTLLMDTVSWSCLRSTATRFGTLDTNTRNSSITSSFTSKLVTPFVHVCVCVCAYSWIFPHNIFGSINQQCSLQIARPHTCWNLRWRLICLVAKKWLLWSVCTMYHLYEVLGCLFCFNSLPCSIGYCIVK